MVEGSTEKRKAGETARQYAYRLLRNEIISLELKPGSPFNDGEFAGRIGLSRTPVREAVIQLSEESRIIEIFPQRGMRAVSYTHLLPDRRDGYPDLRRKENRHKAVLRG